MPFEQLKFAVLTLSQSKDWVSAIQEWSLLDIWEDEPDTCVCGHFPIKEHCLIGNRVTNKSLIVGNCCVKHFMGMSEGGLVLAAIRRVREQPDKGALNQTAIGYAFDHEWINKWEREFYLDTCRKRKLTAKQATKRAQINQKVLLKFERQRKQAQRS